MKKRGAWHIFHGLTGKYVSVGAIFIAGDLPMLPIAMSTVMGGTLEYGYIWLAFGTLRFCHLIATTIAITVIITFIVIPLNKKRHHHLPQYLSNDPVNRPTQLICIFNFFVGFQQTNRKGIAGHS